VLFAVASAAVMGALLGALGAWIEEASALALGLIRVGAALAAAAYGIARLGGRTAPHPQRMWQVPRSWQRFGRMPFAASFGLILGLGLLTYVPFVGFYGLLVVALGLRDPMSGAVVLAAYGLARALPLVVTAVRAGYDLAAVNRATLSLIAQWQRLRGGVAVIQGVLLIGLAGVLIGLR